LLTTLTIGQAQDLLDILEDRSGSGSTLIATQVPVGQWHARIGDPTIADAILDRLIHAAHRIELRGESMRKMRTRAGDEGNRQAGTARSDADPRSEHGGEAV